MNKIFREVLKLASADAKKNYYILYQIYTQKSPPTIY